MISPPLMLTAPYVLMKDGAGSDMLTLKVEVILQEATREVIFAMVTTDAILTPAETEAIQKLFRRCES